MSDQRGEQPPEDVEQLQEEIQQLEERVQVSLGGNTARRLRRMKRQVTEAAPDALFSTGGGVGVRGIARRTDSYGFVLMLLAVLIWIFVPFASSERWATVPTILVFYMTILISMHTSFVRERWLVAVVVLDTSLLLVGLAGVITDNEEVRAISNGGFGVLLFATALVILRRILSHQTITSRTLSGAVAAFLLVGLAFACFAEALVLHQPAAYAADHGNTNFAAMLYFAFVTQATLGYGDIVPVNSAARSLATMQAIMGQIYLVTIVARLVSLLGVRRITTSTDTAPDSSPQSQ